MGGAAAVAMAGCARCEGRQRAFGYNHNNRHNVARVFRGTGVLNPAARAGETSSQ
jgi:hypothetical protein|eukprot:COSAG06_NODE_4467_length_4222_cov_108.624545_1_plen_55_part_00